MKDGITFDHETQQEIDESEKQINELSNQQSTDDSMTKKEAEEAMVNINEESSQVMVSVMERMLSFYLRDGHTALGYTSIKACFVAEVKDGSYSYFNRRLKNLVIKDFLKSNQLNVDVSQSVFETYHSSMKNYSIKSDEAAKILHSYAAALNISQERKLNAPTAQIAKECYLDTKHENASRKKTRVKKKVATVKVQPKSTTPVTKPAKTKPQQLKSTRSGAAAIESNHASDDDNQEEIKQAKPNSKSVKPLIKDVNTAANIASKTEESPSTVLRKPNRVSDYKKCDTKEQKNKVVERMCGQIIANLDEYGITLLVKKMNEHLIRPESAA